LQSNISNFVFFAWYEVKPCTPPLLTSLFLFFCPRWTLSVFLSTLDSQVPVACRPFGGPNGYITVPETHTITHQDGNGTVDAVHVDHAGFNDVIVFPKMGADQFEQLLEKMYGPTADGKPFAFAKAHAGVRRCVCSPSHVCIHLISSQFLF
jgi:hypothetical protein